MIRWVRRIVGVALLAWAAWQVIRPRSWIPLYGVDAETGAPYGVRITPLSPAETAAAIAAERKMFAMRPPGVDASA